MHKLKQKPKLLIVDDEPRNVKLLQAILFQYNYELIVAYSGTECLEKLSENKDVSLILLDIMMPGMNGYEVCDKIKSDDELKKIPIIFLTALAEESNELKGFKAGGADYVTKPFKKEVLIARVKTHILIKKYQDSLEELVKERTKKLELTQEVTIKSMATLAEYRDPETGGHIRRTQNYVKALAVKLKSHPKFSNFLDDTVIELLYKSAPLHDIGKVGVPDHILLKPGKLTDEEFEEMKKHTVYGYDAIVKSEKELGNGETFLKYAAEIAYTHQEKWDGSGYPQGLKGNEIPISGRIMALADVYDALISRRVYKPPFPHSKAVKIIKEGRGTHFDPDMVDAFMEIEEEFREIAIKFADFEDERETLLK